MLMIPCDCTCHAINVEYDKDFIYLNLWFRSCEKWSFKTRIKHAWEVFIKGQRCIHDIVLTEENALSLYNCLDKILYEPSKKYE